MMTKLNTRKLSFCFFFRLQTSKKQDKHREIQQDTAGIQASYAVQRKNEAFLGKTARNMVQDAEDGG